MIYDYLIVGAGLYGSVCARELTDRGYKCLVIDRRNHIGGNCYSELVDGIHNHKYGPHFFHTNNLNIWNYVNRFSNFFPYEHRVKVNYKDTIYSFPINLFTLNQLWGATTAEEAKNKIKDRQYGIENPTNFEELMLNRVGEEIYRKFFYYYSKKHWGMEPKKLPASLVTRIPIRFNYDDRYFTDLYQGLPTDGYTILFENLLRGIEVKLNTQFDHKMSAEVIIYTGSIDEYYDYSLGKLGYRSVYHLLLSEDIGTTVINYTDSLTGYTRKISYGYIYPNMKYKNSSTFEEFSCACGDPAYPINNLENNLLYEKYKDIKTNVIFGGRLGLYSYINMDKTIELALDRVSKL